MSMGRRPEHEQTPMWIAGPQVARSPGHRFYETLNELLKDADFEGDNEPGRRSIAPGVYFRMLFVGYFEGIEIGARFGVALLELAVAPGVPGRVDGQACAGPLEPVADAHAPRRRGL